MSSPQTPDATNADASRLAEGAGINLTGRGIGQVTSFATQILLARLLGPAVFGLYAIGWTLLRMGSVVATLGLENGVLFFGSRYRGTDAARFKGTLWRALGIALVAGAVLAAALVAAAPALSDHVFEEAGLRPVLFWFAPAIILAAGLRVAAAGTRVSQRMQYAIYAEEMTQPLSNLVLVVVLVGMGWGLLGASAAVGISFALALLLAVRYWRTLFPDIFASDIRGTATARTLLAFSIPTVMASICHTYMVWIDRLILGHVSTSAEVGVYQAVAQAAILFAIILSAFNNMLAPMIADLYHRQERGRLDAIYKAGTKWGLYLSVPFFLVVCFAPDAILYVVFGSRYGEGADPLVILSAGHLVHAGAGGAALMLIQTGRQKRWFVLSAGAFGASVALNVWWVPRFGMMGAALATATAVAGLFLAALLETRRVLGFWPYDRRYLKGIAAAAVAVGGLVLLRSAPPLDPVWHLAAVVILAFGLFGGSLLLFGLDAEDRDWIRRLRGRFR